MTFFEGVMVVTLFLCAILACCVTACPTPPVSTQAGCASLSGEAATDPGRLRLSGPPVATCAGEKRGGTALPGRGSAPADSTPIKPLPKGTLTLMGLGMGSAPSFGGASCPQSPGLWEYRCEVDTSYGAETFGSHIDDRPDHWVVSGDVLTGHTLYRLTFDTTCVWERAQGYEYFDTYCMDEGWDWHQPCGKEVRLFREVKR